MKINWRTALFSLVIVSVLTASVLAFSVSSGNFNAQINNPDLICQNHCERHRPTGTCTVGDTLCRTLVGKDCTYMCKIDGTWDNGGACIAHCLNDDGCDPNPIRVPDNKKAIDKISYGNSASEESDDFGNNCVQ